MLVKRLLSVCFTIVSLAAIVFPLAAAEITDGPWRYTLAKPAEGWEKAAFDDAEWKEGFGGFGVRSTPGSRVSTDWRTGNIWLRRSVELDKVPQRPALLLSHDEDAQVYINGTLAAEFTGFTTEYKVVPLQEAGRKALKQGTNLLAVHCSQTIGGQFIDVHIVDADNVPRLPEPRLPVKPFESELITKWGAEVTADNAWTEYPRPQLQREKWTNLNGHWDYAITKLDAAKPAEWAGKILVPYPLESKLSGVQRLLNPGEALWYRRTFNQVLPGAARTKVQPEAKPVLLHFEAVDYRCQAWVNGQPVGEHVGGNTPFSFDITKALKNGENELVLRVIDATGDDQLRGKQHREPHGIWYTRVSGIWQTVWLEELPRRYVSDLKITTDTADGSIAVDPQLGGEALEGEKIVLEVVSNDRVLGRATGAKGPLKVSLPEPRLWSPSDPHLYDLQIVVQDDQGTNIDAVRSYAGIRKVGVLPDGEGRLRLALNDRIVFHWGTLDQGWWPDGLLTPPSDEAMLFEIEYLKAAGFNMIRKHIKVEPQRYYYHCDRLGILVWQDQVSASINPPWTRLEPNPVDAQWKPEDHQQFMREFEAMVDTLENFPSIVVWVPFNEAWGQHRTEEVGKWILQRDPTRTVNIASGGNFWPVGHMVDAHSYPHPNFPFDPERFAPYVHAMGEFGGHGWPVEGHLWDSSERNWGYGGLPKTIDEYKDRYRESIRLLKALKEKGIAAGVYTQTTDVEGEINGLMTYDRKVIKIPAKELAEIHAGLVSDP